MPNKYDVFIEGELMDLCCPSEAAIEDGWHSWFNDPITTRYIRQGLFPNTREDQLDFLETTRKSKDRLLLLIKPKALDQAIGVTSLSSINYIFRTAMSAMVIGNRHYRAPYKELIGLEARARLLQHAFDVMGLERVGGGQLINLRKWQKIQVLFGYRIEGLERKAFRKGQEAFDLFMGSVLLEDYLKLKKLRNGNYWPGAKRMMQLIRQLPEQGFDEIFEKTANQQWQAYVESITLA